MLAGLRIHLLPGCMWVVHIFGLVAFDCHQNRVSHFDKLAVGLYGRSIGEKLGDVGTVLLIIGLFL